MDAVTRQELYFRYMAGDTSVELPQPVTRLEKYWYDICNSLTSEGEIAKIKEAAAEQLEIVQGAADEITEGIIEEAEKAVDNKVATVLPSIPDDYTTLYNRVNANEDKLRTRAPAIVQTAGGETIAVSDSSDDYFRGLRTFGKSTQVTTTGKNLCPINTINASENKSGVVVINGLEHGTYTLSADVTKYSNDATTNTRTTIMAVYTDGTNDTLATSVDITGAECDGVARFKSCTITTDATKTIDYFKLIVLDYSTVSSRNAKAENIQLELGSEATPYEPYTGGAPSPSPECPQEIVSIGDTGTIGVQVLGKNRFDGIWEVGYIYETSGENQSTGNQYWRTRYIPINGTFVVSDELKKEFSHHSVYYYDAQQNYLGNKKVYGGVNNKPPVTPPEGTAYIRMAIESTTSIADMSTIIKNMQVECGTTATAYEPYKPAQTLTHACPSGLPGIEVTDASIATYTDSDGRMWVADEVDWERGVYWHYVLECDNSDLVFYNHQFANDNYFVAYARIDGVSLTRYLGMSTHFPNAKDDGVALQNSSVMYVANNAIHFSVPVSVANSLATLKQWLIDNDVKIFVALSEPYSEPLPPEQIAAYKALHTNKPNTTVMNDAGAWMEMQYNADTKTYVDNKLAEIAAAMLSNA